MKLNAARTITTTWAEAQYLSAVADLFLYLWATGMSKRKARLYAME